MSSVVTEDFVPGRKLVVHVAENGRSLEIDCNESTPVEAVQQCIESVSGIRFNDQLLLCLDMKLEPQQPLSTYKLPCDNKEVFLYNRARLHQDSPAPPPEQVDIPEVHSPPSPSSSQNPHPLDDALDPALKALPSYEHQFRYHFQRGRAVYGCTQMKIEACERLLREQGVQERALDTATGSIEHYYQMVYQMYTEFMKRYSQQHRHHSDLLVNLSRDIEKLRNCKLHPSLQTGSRKCLLDLVKEENLRKWAENCASSHRQFETKVSQLKVAFAELRRQVEYLFSCKPSAAIRDMEIMIKDHHQYLNEQKSIMQSLSKDVNTVKKLVDDCLSSQLTASLRPHDAVSALGPMYDVHDKNHLPRMEACDRAITKLVDIAKTKKNEMNIFVHKCMQKVAYIQYMIKDIRLQFPAFKEAMTRQEDLFEHLKLVRGIGPAYRACLAEVIRRKASMKLYMGLAGQLAERLAAKREVEVRRREDFLKAQTIYMPRDILESMGLFDSPSHCDVNMAPFDTNLLEIDIIDLDRYAPEYLLGMASKAEKCAMSKGSSISGDSCQLAETGETSLEKSEDEDLFDCCESVEIAGTSKLEVENARLKAELASALAQICSFGPEFEYMSLSDSKIDNLLKSNAEKTAEALHLKDEYGKHLQSMLKMKQMQCLSYEKRIQELEQRLSDQYQKFSGKDVSDLCKSEVSGDGEANMPYISTEPMEEVSCTSAASDTKLEQFSGRPGKNHEGVDENMADLLAMFNQQASGSARNSMDSSMREQHQEEAEIGDKCGKETPEVMAELPNNTLPSGHAEGQCLASKAEDNLILELQSALEDKSKECSETESKLKAALEDVATLNRDLEVSRKLLEESQLFPFGLVNEQFLDFGGCQRNPFATQMNCAHLENCLHEAREEAHTNLCAADRRASEYSALRASAVKMRGLFERLRGCVTSSSGPAGFADSLRSLALSLASSHNDNEDDGTAEFRACIRVLADKVGLLSRHRAELLDRCTRSEGEKNLLMKEIEDKKELVKSLYAKHQLEKQANKEKISFGRLELHELAAFVLNSGGHYEAINRNYSNYYLSAESVALFTEHCPSKPNYIVGQIVHIERRTVKTPPPVRSSQGDQVDLLSSSDTGGRMGQVPSTLSNPYDLPIGCEYFVVTVAMLPDTIHSPPS
ncbi:hypothetical protein ACLOJK_002680 [Asimina triloba]